jgi:hypothetical protein
LADEGSQAGLGESIKRQRRKRVAGGLVTMSQQPSRKRKGNPKNNRSQPLHEERKGTGKLRIRDNMVIP